MKIASKEQSELKVEDIRGMVKKTRFFSWEKKKKQEKRKKQPEELQNQQ